MKSPRVALAALVTAVLLSSLALVQSTHESRNSYAVLQQLEANRWYLQEQYSRLMLERSTLASPHRIARMSGDELVMKAPELTPSRVVLLVEPR